MRYALLGGGAISSLIAAMAVGSAQAQQTAPATAEDDTRRDVVVVTAQKRAEDVQDVPISITAFSGEALEDAGVKDIRDLKYITPGLNFATAPQTTNTRLSIRGIGTSGNTAIEPSVGVYIDGVYVPRVGSLLAGLNDISAVEVLRGPQGTLFGRNASMGALNIRTTDPGRDFGGRASILLGDFNRTKAEASVDAPLSDVLRTRLSVMYDDRDGYGYNDITRKSVGDNRVISVRTALAWDISDTLSWSLKGDYQRTTGDGAAVVTVVKESVRGSAEANWRRATDPDGTSGPLTGDVPVLNNTYTLTLHQENEGVLNDMQHGFASDLTWEAPAGYTVKLISGYRDWTNAQYQASTGNFPLGGTPRQGFYSSVSTSNELQLISPDTLLDGKFNYVAGLYQYTETFKIGDTRYLQDIYCNIFIRNTSTPARVASCLSGPKAPSSYTNFSQDTDAYAVYWQGNYSLTDTWKLTAGIRHSSDEKTGLFDQRAFNLADAAATETTALDLSEEKTTYRLATSYNVTDDLMLFASWSTGFKSGGFDSGRGTTVVGAKRKFNAETTTNMEAGVKSVSLNGALTANATAFETSVDDYQFRTFDGVSFGVRNNGSIRIRGIEWELTALPTDNLTIGLSGSFLDSRYTDFRGAPGLPARGGTQDLTGEKVPFTADSQVNAYAEYQQPLVGPWSMSVRSDMSYISSMILSSAGDNDPATIEPRHTVFGLRLEFENRDEDLILALAGQNIGNELACTLRFAQPQDLALGLRDSASGSTVYRCPVSAPRTWAIEARKRF